MVNPKPKQPKQRLIIAILILLQFILRKDKWERRNINYIRRRRLKTTCENQETQIIYIDVGWKLRVKIKKHKLYM